MKIIIHDNELDSNSFEFNGKEAQFWYDPDYNGGGEYTLIVNGKFYTRFKLSEQRLMFERLNIEPNDFYHNTNNHITFNKANESQMLYIDRETDSPVFLRYYPECAAYQLHQWSGEDYTGFLRRDGYQFLAEDIDEMKSTLAEILEGVSSNIDIKIDHDVKHVRYFGELSEKKQNYIINHYKNLMSDTFETLWAMYNSLSVDSFFYDYFIDSNENFFGVVSLSGDSRILIDLYKSECEDLLYALKNDLEEEEDEYKIEELKSLREKIENEIKGMQK